MFVLITALVWILYFMCTDKPYSIVFPISAPEDIVADSGRAWLSITGKLWTKSGVTLLLNNNCTSAAVLYIYIYNTTQQNNKDNQGLYII